MAIKVIGLDIAKNVFQVHGKDEAGRVVLRRKLRRCDVLKLFTSIEPRSLASKRATRGTIGLARSSRLDMRFDSCRRNRKPSVKARRTTRPMLKQFEAVQRERCVLCRSKVLSSRQRCCYTAPAIC